MRAPEAAGGLGGAEIERRLLEMGFVEGAPVRLVHEGLLGRDPIAVKLADRTVALRRREARAVMVRADAELMQQALLNLLLNGMQAMPRLQMSPTCIGVDPGTAGGGEVRLSIVQRPVLAGVLPGDILLEVDGTPVRRARALAAALGPERIGQPVAVRLLRAGELRTLSLGITARPPRFRRSATVWKYTGQ